VKLLPLMVSVNAAPPAVAEAGLRLEIAGGLVAAVAAAPENMFPSILSEMSLLGAVTAVSAAGSRPSTSIVKKTTFDLRKNERARCN
jgi:hypothetical protein